MFEPTGRVVLVSGANRGIGAAIAAKLHERGYKLSLGARDPSNIGIAEGARVMHAGFEATDKTTHQRWVEATFERFGRIDGLVNNAGMGGAISIEEDNDELLDKVFAVNVKAPLSMIRLCLPHLRLCGSGRIINVASLSGKRVRNDNVAYNMSKFAVMALTHSARRIAWKDGVRATALCPSFVATDMTADVTKVSPAEMISPEDLAELVATVLALPNTASIAELLVNCRLEDTV
ncbi:MAG: SDR family NAD(P)-dependent oxidoreductase [Geminicoccaceae bacterium]